VSKLLYIAGVVVLGSMVVTLLDNALGVRIDGSNGVAVIAHRLVHMAWGAILITVFREKDGEENVGG
jgi:hypothetical protein